MREIICACSPLSPDHFHGHRDCCPEMQIAQANSRQIAAPHSARMPKIRRAFAARPIQLGVRIQVPPGSEAIKPHIEGVETLSQIFPNAALIHAVCDKNQRAAYGICDVVMATEGMINRIASGTPPDASFERTELRDQLAIIEQFGLAAV